VNRDLRDSRPIRFILASASPARLATLRSAGVEPEVVVSSIDESAYHERSVSAQVHGLAQAKAQDVAGRVAGDGLVLGCDSLLEVDGVGYGKPLTADRAVARWRQVRGKRGELHTGHALVHVSAGRVVGRASVDVPSGIVMSPSRPDAMFPSASTPKPWTNSPELVTSWFCEFSENEPSRV